MEKKYYKHKIENLIVIDKIVTIHYLESGKDFYFHGEKHDFWELVYADKESIIIEKNGEKIIVNEGEMIFHKPDEYHSLAANGVTAPSVFIISFECKSRAIHFFENKLIKLNKNFLKYVYAIIDEGKKTFNLPYFNPELKKMELLDHPALGGEQLIKNLLELLLILVMRSETEKANSDAVFLSKDELDGRISKAVISFLKEKVNDKLTVEEVCAELNYNRSYVFQQFKKDTGYSIMSYFMRLKIERAKRLIREGNLNVTQISEKLSFEAPNYFSKTFKKFTGLTPMQYRNISRSGGA